MPSLSSKGDQCLLIFKPDEAPEINDTWITELIAAHYEQGRKWAAQVQVLILVDTWVEPEGRTFDV